MESIALKAAMVLPPLLLQKPHRQLKFHEHFKCLERRLQLWRKGNITTLLEEGLTIHQYLKQSCYITSADSSRVFARLIFHGKIKAAMHFLTEQSRWSFCPYLHQFGSLLSLMNSLGNIQILLQLLPQALLLSTLPLFRAVILLFLIV